MAKHVEGKTFGVIPSGRIRVRVEAFEGGKAVKTESYSIYGGDMDTVCSVVTSALGEAFPSDEEEQAPPPPVVMKKKARR